jgi:[ribosomal protein S5]-alanine N-acetyltransferase
MLAAPETILTPRLTLRAARPDQAQAMWPVLSDPALYRWIAREPPASVANVEARLARISQRTAPDRAEQWLNWTVWRRDSDEAIGIVEATVSRSNDVLIAYMFAPRIWGQGYAREATAAAIDAMRTAGAHSFTATIDVRNEPSRKLAQRLDFHCVERRMSEDIIAGAASEEEVWRLNVDA